MLPEPLDRGGDIHVPEVHYQVDRPAATLMAAPVEEPGARYRKRATLGPPLVPLAPITLGAPAGQQVNTVSSGIERIASACRRKSRDVTATYLSSLSRKLSHSFMLMT